MSVMAVGRGRVRKLRANGALLQLRERFFGVTVARTVTQVIENARERIAEIDKELERRREELTKLHTPAFGGDVEAMRSLIEKYDVFQFVAANNVILNKPMREAIFHVSVMNLLDQLRGSYVMVADQLQVEIDTAKSAMVRDEMGNGQYDRLIGPKRVMQLYFHDVSILSPIDVEDIESHCWLPDMIGGPELGEYGVVGQMEPMSPWGGRRRQVGNARGLPPQQIGTFAELETTLRAHAKADGEQDA